MEEMKFSLGDRARIKCSGEIGDVIGIAFYTTHSQVCLRYKAADNRAVEAWWNVDALELCLPAVPH